MIRPLVTAAMLALPLAGCDNKPGASFTLNTSGQDGTVTMSDNGQTGEVALNVPGFSGKLKLPKLHLDGNDIELNGVHLYPGSKVTGMNIDSNNDDGVARIQFDSPADPNAVRAWFQDRLSKVGFTLHADGNGLTGTTDENKPFKLELQPDGNGHAKGTIAVS